MTDDSRLEAARQWARDYQRAWSPVIRPMAKVILPHLELSDAGRIIDVGTGTGALIPALRAAAPGAHIVGVDRSFAMIEIARGSSGETSVMDAHRLAFPARTFDVALAAFVLFALSDPGAALREVARVLSPGGRFGSITWGASDEPAYERVWEEELAEAGASPKGKHPSNDQVDTDHKMRDLLLAGGFSSARAWTESTDRSWTPTELLDHWTVPSAARFWGLSEDAREQVRAHAERRLATLAPDEFVGRYEVVSAVGRSPL